MRAGDLQIDLARHRVRVKNQEVDLTATEFELLAVMARQPGRVFTRAQLLDAIHGVSFESFERAIDSHIKNIRRKIEPNPQEPVHLIMVYGVGYKLAEAGEGGSEFHERQALVWLRSARRRRRGTSAGFFRL